MSHSPVITARLRGVLRITLNRPQARNAISGEMYDSLRRELTDAAEDAEVKVVLLEGVGRTFCAGNDLNGFSSIREIPMEQRPGFRFMNTLALFPKPVVACVKGDAVGIGATLLLHCDLVYAVESVRLIFPFLRIGLVPEFASTLILPRLMGHPRAFELLTQRSPCSAPQALELGLINEIVATGSIDAAVAARCEALASEPADALVTLKRLMKASLSDAFVPTIAAEMRELNRCLETPETQAALRQAAQRRGG